MLRYLFWILAIYFLYRLVFYFIIPVFKVSQRMKQQVKEFQQNVHANNENPFSTNGSATPEPEKKTSKSGDYIDFEEVK